MLKHGKRTWAVNRRGAVVVLVAIAGTVMVGFAALTIDLGNMYIVRTELQRAADASAIAAAAKLSRYQAGVSETAARDEAERIVEGNPIDGKKARLDLSKDVEFGRALWNDSTKAYSFSAGGSTPNAVRVTVRKTKDSPNGSLRLLFANMLGSQTNLTVRAAAMIVPRDIAVVADLSGSMNYDSQFHHYKMTPINLWNIWVCLPIEKGNNGVGNGIDPPPPGNPPLNDGYGTGPGNPGNRGGADPKTDPGLMGPTWGRMNTWGTLEITDGYNPLADPGLMYLPYNASWNSDTELKNWFAQVGYNSTEIGYLVAKDNTTYKYRVAVALGLARWDSGKSGGLWSKLPRGKTRNTENWRDDDSRVEERELEWLVNFPLEDISKDPNDDAGYWLDWIDDYVSSSGTKMYAANASLRYRYGLKTFVNYLLEVRRTFAETPDLAGTPEQPMQAVKDGLAYCMELLTDMDSHDQVSLEIYGTTARHERNLTQDFLRLSEHLNGMQAAHYDADTNMGGGIDKAIKELTSTRARSYAAKVMFLMTDGHPSIKDSDGESYARQKVKEAIGKGIQIYCISVGADVNRELMQEFARLGGGKEEYAVGTIEQYSQKLKDIFGEFGSKRVVRLIE